MTPERFKELDLLSEEVRAVIDQLQGRGLTLGVPALKELGMLGLEYLKVCKQSQNLGVDWANASSLTDPPLVAFPQNLKTIQERLIRLFEPFAVISIRARRDDEPVRK